MDPEWRRTFSINCTPQRLLQAISIFSARPNLVNRKIFACEVISSSPQLHDLPSDISLPFTPGLIDYFKAHNVQKMEITRRVHPRDRQLAKRTWTEFWDFAEMAVEIIPDPPEDKNLQEKPENSDPTRVLHLVKMSLKIKDSTLEVILNDVGDGLSPNSIWFYESRVIPKILGWASNSEVKSTSSSTPEGSLNAIPVGYFSEVYQRLKKGHAKKLKEIWGESTDPDKFIHEEMSIAAYLITLWRNTPKFKLKFIDIGCGNGLLTYLLTSEGYKGIGVDIRARDIWKKYPIPLNLIVKSINPSLGAGFDLDFEEIAKNGPEMPQIPPDGSEIDLEYAQNDANGSKNSQKCSEMPQDDSESPKFSNIDKNDAKSVRKQPEMAENATEDAKNGAEFAETAQNSTKSFEKNSEASKIPKSSRNSQEIPKIGKNSQEIPKINGEIPVDGVASTKMLPDGAKFSKNTPDCVVPSKKLAEFPLDDLEIHKSPNNTKNLQELSKNDVNLPSDDAKFSELPPDGADSSKNAPEITWYIGNHSDELTPWIPLLARSSSASFFIIPCCPWDFYAKYQRKPQYTGKSTYQNYLDYIKDIGERCGFKITVDCLRIPSTKRVALIGNPDLNVPKGNWSFEPDLIINGGGSDFSPRPAIELVRNCTQIPQNLIQSMISKIFYRLLEESHVLMEVGWTREGNRGSSGVTLREVMGWLEENEVAALGAQHGGLQTLIRNHNHIFTLEGSCVRLKIPRAVDEGVNEKVKGALRTKPCWLNLNHPDGCPVPKDHCFFAHKNCV